MSVFRASNTPQTDWSVPVQRGPYPPEYTDQEEPTERIYLAGNEPEPLAEPGEEPYPEDPDERRRRAVAVALCIDHFDAGLDRCAVRGGVGSIGAHQRGVIDLRVPIGETARHLCDRCEARVAGGNRVRAGQ